MIVNAFFFCKPGLEPRLEPSAEFIVICESFCFVLIYSQPTPPDILSEESDTASITSSISSPKPVRKARKNKLYNVKPKVDTNLSSKRKEIVTKSSTTAIPRLRVTTPLPYNSRHEDYSPLSPRSRDPSPARGANR